MSAVSRSAESKSKPKSSAHCKRIQTLAKYKLRSPMKICSKKTYLLGRTTSVAATLKGAAIGMTAGAIRVGEAAVILTGGPAPRTTVPETAIVVPVGARARAATVAVVPVNGRKDETKEDAHVS